MLENNHRDGLGRFLNSYEYHKLINDAIITRNDIRPHNLIRAVNLIL